MNQSFCQWVSPTCCLPQYISVSVTKCNKSEGRIRTVVPKSFIWEPRRSPAKSHLTSQSGRDELHIQIVLHYILPFCVVLHWRQTASRLSSRGSIVQKESLSLAVADKSTADWLGTKGFSLNFKAAENFMSDQLAQKAPKSRAKSGTSRGADGCVSFLKLRGINVAFRKTSISCSRQSTWLYFTLAQCINVIT